MPLEESMEDDFLRWQEKKKEEEENAEDEDEEGFSSPPGEHSFGWRESESATKEEIANKQIRYCETQAIKSAKERRRKIEEGDERSAKEKLIDDNRSPSQWVEARSAQMALRDLRRDYLGLEAQFHIIFKFFLDPLWEVIAELQERFEENPNPIRREQYMPQAAPGNSTPAAPMTPPWVLSADEKRQKTMEVPIGLTLERVKCLYALREFARRRGNKMSTARALGINIKTLYHSFDRWGKLYGKEVTDIIDQSERSGPTKKFKGRGEVDPNEIEREGA
jgi:hypothetical protein